MHDSQQEILHSANRRIRRVRRTTGRLVASALGFGVAYYFDTENGALRRKRLHQSFQRAAQRIGAVLGPEAEDPPSVLSPMRRVREPEGPPPAEDPAPRTRTASL
jgi:hypothetical protein